MSSQISTAMMSAPSSASRMACSRPWPRAAPVMNATLPATLPTLLSVIVAFRLKDLPDAGGDRQVRRHRPWFTGERDEHARRARYCDHSAECSEGALLATFSPSEHARHEEPDWSSEEPD